MRVFITYTLLLLTIILGCQDSELPFAPHLTGSIVGFVSLIDESGHPLTDNRGVKVILLPGISFDTTTTDSSGRWEFNNVQIGMKTVVLQKEGYFGEEIGDIPFAGSGYLFLEERSHLYPIPTFYVLSATARSDTLSKTITVEGEMTQAARTHPLPVILSFGRAINTSPFDGYFLFYEFAKVPVDSQRFLKTILVDSAFKDSIGLKRGERLYISALPCSPFTPLTIYNKYKGKVLPAYFGTINPDRPFAIPQVIVP